MKAVQYSEYGGPEVLTVGEAPEPHAGPGQVRIAVKAASINGFDRKLISGMMAGGKPMEGTGYLGFDAAGVVDEIGEGVSGVGGRRRRLRQGRNTQAEYAVLDSWAAQTRFRRLESCRRCRGGGRNRRARTAAARRGGRATLFVDGGAGGVGAVAVQVAVAAVRRSSRRPARTTTTTCARSGRSRCTTDWG